VNVLLFGATGMIGQGALRECLLDPDVDSVIAVGRKSAGQAHPKLREIIEPDVTHVEPELARADACLFCLGVSVLGLSEDAYTRITHDLTLSIANTLLRANADLTFLYVSGAGTDSTEKGRAMWARVKGRTENALLRLPFKAAYMFRPGAIMPMHGVRSSTSWYNAVYAVLRPIVPILRRVRPTSVTTTEQLGRAMLAVAKRGYHSRVLEMADIIRF
jgi:uncharacterized protein YbjT (DUF2867 family)